MSNPLKKGPELKLPKLRKPSLKEASVKGPRLARPDLNVPGPLVDFYYDLRDRRLLPVLALVLIAIVATPILLGDKNEPVSASPAANPVLEAATKEPTSKLTVVEATPGLREYRKRLRGRTPTDPFEQRFTGPPAGAAPGGGEATTSSESASAGASAEVTAEEGSVAVEVETGGSSDGGGSSSGGSSHGSGGAKSGGGPGAGTHLFEFVFDVQISHTEQAADGGRQMSEPEARHDVKTLAQLPSKKVPLVTLGGVNLHNGNVWFLVSDEAKSLDGDFTCVSRTPAGLCELLEIEPGFPLEITYGPEDVLYRLKVTKVDTVSAGKVGDGSRSSRAAFGLVGDAPRRHP